MMILLQALTSCRTTKQNDCYYAFPSLEEARRIENEKKIILYDKEGKEIFKYDSETDMVSVQRSYWLQIITYGINTGGLTSEK